MMTQTRAEPSVLEVLATKTVIEALLPLTVTERLRVLGAAMAFTGDSSHLLIATLKARTEELEPKAIGSA